MVPCCSLFGCTIVPSDIYLYISKKTLIFVTDHCSGELVKCVAMENIYSNEGFITISCLFEKA